MSKGKNTFEVFYSKDFDGHMRSANIKTNRTKNLEKILKKKEKAQFIQIMNYHKLEKL